MTYKPPVGWGVSPSNSISTKFDSWFVYHAGVSSAAWGTQYRAIYIPVRVARPVVVKELMYGCQTTATGNVDIGIYDAAGTRLVSTGSTAKITYSASYVPIDVTDTTLQRGLYYLALNNDTTTDTFVTYSIAAPMGGAHGVLTETLGSITLPATATWALDQTLTFVPLIAAAMVTEIDV